MRKKTCTTHEAVQLWLVPKFPSIYPDHNFFIKCKSNVLFLWRGSVTSPLPRAPLSSLNYPEDIPELESQ